MEPRPRILNGLPALGPSEGTLFWLDPGLLAEPSEAYTKCHNVYGRASPVNKAVPTAACQVFQALKAEGDVIVCFDQGRPRTQQLLKTAMSKIKPGKIQFLELVPSQSDLEKRSNYQLGGVRGEDECCP